MFTFEPLEIEIDKEFTITRIYDTDKDVAAPAPFYNYNFCVF